MGFCGLWVEIAKTDSYQSTNRINCIWSIIITLRRPSCSHVLLLFWIVRSTAKIYNALIQIVVWVQNLRKIFWNAVLNWVINFQMCPIYALQVTVFFALVCEKKWMELVVQKTKTPVLKLSGSVCHLQRGRKCVGGLLLSPCEILVWKGNVPFSRNWKCVVKLD